MVDQREADPVVTLRLRPSQLTDACADARISFSLRTSLHDTFSEQYSRAVPTHPAQHLRRSYETAELLRLPKLTEDPVTEWKNLRGRTS
jgi:hypothetical protein